MINYEIIELNDSSILYIYSIKDEIDLSPDYQRMSDVWNSQKKQLLIDTLINDYDIPKIYIHELSSPVKKDGQIIQYAVVDGKQRLKSIFDFIENRISLADDFTHLKDPKLDLSGMTYKDLAETKPRIKIKFDAKRLPIYMIRTNDLDVIEDMFSRLNEATPLNAAEKRNAFGGPVPKLIRKIAEHDFFKKRVPFSEKRYRHYEVAVKLLYFIYQNKIVDMKKQYLDSFVMSFKKKKFPLSTEQKVYRVLDGLSETFLDNDNLLRSIGTVPIYFWLSKLKGDISGGYKLSRERINKFEELRKRNRKYAIEDIETEKIDFNLLEYDRLVQTPFDSYSIRYKCEIMSNFIFSSNVNTQIQELLRIKK